MLYALIFLAAFQLPPQAPPVEKPDQAPLVIDEKPTSTPRDRYLAAYAQSIKTGKPLVVFVGRGAIDFPWAVTESVPAGQFPDYPTRCVIVGVPYPDGVVRERGVLSVGASESEIRLLAGKAVQPAASPFVPSVSPASTTARPDRPGAGSGRYHKGHDCPSCGRIQTAIESWNQDGTHAHTCPRCRVTWHH